MPEKSANELEEVKVVAPHPISFKEMPCVPPLPEQSLKDESKIVANKTPEEKPSNYVLYKSKTDPLKHASELFTQKQYVTDYESLLKPKPTYTVDAYKKKASSFSTQVIKTYSKDLTAYAGNFK